MAAQQAITRNGETKRTWQDIALELMQEQDHTKLIALCHELNDVMIEEERLKTQQRIGLVTNRT